MNHKRINTKGTALAVTFSMVVLIIGCASFKAAYHKYVMRGTVLESAGNEVYLCMGSRDGAQAGQKFDVYRLVSMGATQPGKGGVTGLQFRKEKTGTIKITQIVNEHFARAEVTSGTVLKDYIAELEFPMDCSCNK